LNDNKPTSNKIDVKKYLSNNTLIELIKSNFNEISTPNAIKLIELILKKPNNIHASDINTQHKRLVHRNLSMFDAEGNLKKEHITKIELQISGSVKSIRSGILEYDGEGGDADSFVLTELNNYNEVRQKISEHGRNTKFYYNFDNPDLSIKPLLNKETLQRCYIQIMNSGIEFEYPIIYLYRCEICQNEFTKKEHEVASTKNKAKCPGIKMVETDSGIKTKPCGQMLYPDMDETVTKNAYFFNVSYEDGSGIKRPATAFAFKDYEPGLYECALLRIARPNQTSFLFIIDIKNIEKQEVPLPEKVEGENYLITLQKSIDAFIKEKTGLEIYALYPIKVALIIQAVASAVNFPLIYHCQLVGDRSTGKSTVLKYYGFMLHNYKHMTTNSTDLSIPGLRGSKERQNILGKEQSLVTMGLLGSYRSIHIEEAADNKELVQQLKGIALSTNYSYNKFGSDKISRIRTSHINLSENIKEEFISLYHGSIKKAYLNDTSIIQSYDRDSWNEKWNLHMPLYEYMNNPYLLKIIREKRLELGKKQLFWIDGYDLALHQRWPFYFYLVNDGTDDKLSKIQKQNLGRVRISEDYQLIRKLNNDNIFDFFKTIKKYELENDVTAFDKVKQILKDYGFDNDGRTYEFWCSVLKISRMVNQRYKYEKEDFDLIRWFLDKIDRRLPIAETGSYIVKNAPDLGKFEKEYLDIENKTQEISDEATQVVFDG
jgi:hypothetical protein